MIRLIRLNALHRAAIWYVYQSEPGTEARRIRATRLRRIAAAYLAEAERVDEARLRRLAPYHKRNSRRAA